MSTTQQSGIFTVVDDAGNTIELYPEVLTDETLTQSGKPADATTVGEVINSLNDKLPLPLTQSKYDELSEAEQKNGRLYVIVEETT